MAVDLDFEHAPLDSAAFDPMTAWIAGVGRAFVTFLKDTQNGTNDFRHVAVIDDRDPVGSIKGGRSRVLELPLAEPGAFPDLQQFASDVAGDLKDWEPRFFLLPVVPNGIEADCPLFADQQPSDTREDAAPVVAIIDYAINIAHDRFRRPDGTTRMMHVWDQAGDPNGKTVPFGRAWTADGIDSVIDANDDDEERVLRALGQINFGKRGYSSLAQAASHGTHVLDLATGASGHDKASAPPIFAVALPPIAARETSGAFLGICFLLGIDFILSRVRQSSGSATVFLNFSLSLTGGPRQGRHILERALDGLIKQHRDLGGGNVTVVMAAGNRNLAQGHAVKNIPATGGTASLFWRTQPGDPSANMLDIWITHDQDTPLQTIGLKMTSPDGREISGEMAPAGVWWVTSGEDVIGRVSLSTGPDATPDPGGRKALRLSIILAPSDPGQTRRTPAPPGRWTVTVKTSCGADVAGWVMRDDVVPGFGDTGRQSYLEDPNAPRHDAQGAVIEDDAVPPRSHIRHAGTMNALATSRAAHTFCVGAAVGRSTTTAPGPFATAYSAAPLPPQNMFDSTELIDKSAVADRSMAQPGVIGAGTASGARRAMNGTSVAAPRALRALLEGTTAALEVPAPEPSPRLAERVLMLPAAPNR